MHSPAERIDGAPSRIEYTRAIGSAQTEPERRLLENEVTACWDCRTCGKDVGGMRVVVVQETPSGNTDGIRTRVDELDPVAGVPTVGLYFINAHRCRRAG